MRKLILLLFLTSINIFLIQAQRLYNVSWSTITGLSDNEDYITNTSTTAGNAISNNYAASGEAGYVEFTNYQTDKTKSVGIITDGNTGTMNHYFSFVNNTVAIYNGTTLKVAAYTFNKGDRFKISFSGTTMEFYHNGIKKTYYTFTNAAQRIKIILTSQNSSFSGIKTSMSVPYTLNRPNDKNFVQTITPLQAVTTITASGEQRKTGDYIETVSYYDGLGRPLQTVGAAQSPMMRDAVQPVYYDNAGRNSRQYLPYTVKTTSNGTYQSNAINTTTGDPDAQKTNLQPYYSANEDYKYAYNEVKYDGSPLNRVTETIGTGADWKGKLTTNPTVKSVKYDYGTNNTDILQIHVDEGSLPAKYYLQGKYAPGSLIRTTVTDENGHKTEEFKDKQGRVLLKRGYTGTKTLSTYYAYDDLGRLRLVVQPKGSTSLETTFASIGTQQYYIPDNIVNTNCFCYEYDARQRLTTKLVPGQTVKQSGETRGGAFMVYNKRDQLVLSQDGNLTNQNKWRFVKYDIYGRPVMTGIYSPGSAITQAQMQSNVDNSTLSQYENRNASLTYGYTTDQSYPSANLEVEAVTCYDDYSYPGVSYAYTTKSGFTNAPTQRVDGMVTAQKVKVLGTTTWITSIFYYDEYGRAIQASQNNLLTGTDVTTSEYSFTGNVNKVLLENTVKFAGETKSYTIQKRYVYDNADRLVDSYEKINSEAEVQLSRVAYSETGAIKEKNTHITTTKPAIQSIDYSYNVRGWLTGINNTDLNDGESDLFGMKLMYNDLGSYISGAKQYNGNIAASEWYGKWTNPTNTSDTYTGKHAYTYDYDGIDRVTSAQYYKGGTRSTNFDFAATYDDNGNIKTMQQNAGGYGQIDNLSYAYEDTEQGNRLRAVGDAAADLANRGDFSELTGYEGTTNTEYTYDDNGNMLEDKNRNIKIQYNSLDLPSKVTVGANTIDYVYDANGTKLKKTVTIGSTVTNTYYIGELVYSDNGLQYGLTAEGRFVKDVSTHRYEYFMQDHLGNTRMAYTDLGADGIVDKMQEDSYYPFGLKMPGFTALYAGYTGNKLQYNGQEMQDDIAGFGFLDYNFRFYDVPIGRFNSIDRLASVFAYQSPYNYAENKPIHSVDLDGLEAWISNDGNVMFGPYSTDYAAECGYSMAPFPATDYYTPQYYMEPPIFTFSQPAMEPLPLKPLQPIDASQLPNYSSTPELAERSNNKTNQAGVPSGQGDGTSYTAAVGLAAARLAPGWVVAGAEPTPVGEVVMGIATLATAAYIVHANSKNSLRPNIVYEIYKYNSLTGYQIMKYGISSRADFITRSGNPRPEYQCLSLNATSMFSGDYYWYTILARTPDRASALEMERRLVNDYMKMYGVRPPLQFRP